MAQSNHQLIYGQDDRMEITLVTNQCVARQASAVAGQIWNRQLIPSQRKKGSFNFVKESLASSYPFCDDERFIEQNTLPRCTGFHLGKNILLTAGHCLAGEGYYSDPQSICDQTSWVFTYDEQKTSFHSKEIHPCLEVLEYSDDPSRDYALIRIGGPKIKKKLSPSYAPPTLDQEVFAIGHGSFLPKKIYGGASIKSFDGTLILTNLDTYAGNSGSPVFLKENNRVMGILTGGSTDYEYDQDRNCLMSKRLSDSVEDAQEEVIPLYYIESILRTYGF